MRVYKEFIDMAIKKTRERNSDNLLFTDMAKIINKYETKLRKNKSKLILKDLGKTKLKVRPILFSSSGPVGKEKIINEVTKTLSKGYNKIIGILSEVTKFDINNEAYNERELLYEFGHYIIIGKSNKNNLYIIDVQENKIYNGLNKIINYLWEDYSKNNILLKNYTVLIYDYQNGLVLKKKK